MLSPLGMVNVSECWGLLEGLATEQWVIFRPASTVPSKGCERRWLHSCINGPGSVSTPFESVTLRQSNMAGWKIDHLSVIFLARKLHSKGFSSQPCLMKPDGKTYLPIMMTCDIPMASCDFGLLNMELHNDHFPSGSLCKSGQTCNTKHQTLHSNICDRSNPRLL